MSGPFRRKDFDAPAFYAALNKIRNLRDFTWKEVSAASGVSTTTLSRMADGRHPDAASLASLSHWAGMNPANFMADPDKPPYDTSLAAIAARLRNSVAWLRDGTPTTGGGIGLGDMIELLPIVDAALVSPPPQATGALSEAEIPSPSLLAELGDGRKVYGYTAREVEAIVAALSSAKREADPQWIGVEAQRPAPDAIVLVCSESWDKPKVLKFESRMSNGKPWERFIDNSEGRWYWYPERMHWQPCPEKPAAYQVEPEDKHG